MDNEIYNFVCILRQYANSVIFWTENHRNVIRSAVRVIETLLEFGTFGRSRSSRAVIWRRTRNSEGSYAFLHRHLRNEDLWSFKNYVRITDEQFDQILNLIRRDIEKCMTNARTTISPEEQLAVTLRYLATGETYRSLAYQTRLSHSYLVYCIPEVCKAIWKHLSRSYLKVIL